MQGTQGTPPTPPTPPTTPPPAGDFGSAIGQVIGNAVSTALTSAQAAMQQELDATIRARDVTQGQLDAATASRERSSLNRVLTSQNKKIADLRNGLEKLKNGQEKVSQQTYSSTAPPSRPPQNIDDVVPTTMIVSVMSILFIGFPLSIAFARIMWRRATHGLPQQSPAISVEQTRRFDQLEQAVDSIAIEIERISENQRYLTKVLSEPKGTAGTLPKS